MGYINALIQCLYYCSAFKNEILNYELTKDEKVFLQIVRNYISQT